jgi:hypothetical protein
MNATRLTMHIVPKEMWSPDEVSMSDIFPFVEDAAAIERRIPKGVNLTNERMRYQLCCSRIQKAVLGMEEHETVVLSWGYYDILLAIYNGFPVEARNSRLTACFFPPDAVQAHLAAFIRLAAEAGFQEYKDVKKRIEVFQKAASIQAGVVETPEYLGEASDEGEVDMPEIREAAGKHPHPVLREEDRLSKEERAEMLELFKAQISEAIEHGGAVNFSNQPHFIIADALNDFVYKTDPDDSEKFVRVIYMDGSEAAPFPIWCLTRLADSNLDEEVHPIKAALISMRHVAMDETVDFAWFRNSKVSVARPFAETDAYCTEKTMELLHEIEDQAMHLHLYQTGLETAVVGFYRGLVQVLKDRRNSDKPPLLQVVPYYYVREEDAYRTGQPWA